jgi:putative endonuclease
MMEHHAGDGCHYTMDRLPVELIYLEVFDQIDQAFYREKQIQKWSRAKKEALIYGNIKKLKHLSRNHTEHPKKA